MCWWQVTIITCFPLKFIIFYCFYCNFGSWSQLKRDHLMTRWLDFIWSNADTRQGSLIHFDLSHICWDARDPSSINIDHSLKNILFHFSLWTNQNSSLEPLSQNSASCHLCYRSQTKKMVSRCDPVLVSRQYKSCNRLIIINTSFTNCFRFAGIGFNLFILRNWAFVSRKFLS